MRTKRPWLEEKPVRSTTHRQPPSGVVLRSWIVSMVSRVRGVSRVSKISKISRQAGLGLGRLGDLVKVPCAGPRLSREGSPRCVAR
jgi:hypothetical protein